MVLPWSLATRLRMSTSKAEVEMVGQQGRVAVTLRRRSRKLTTVRTVGPSERSRQSTAGMNMGGRWPERRAGADWFLRPSSSFSVRHRQPSGKVETNVQRS